MAEMKSFKRHVDESRRSSAEASVQRHWKEMDSIRDLKDKGVTASHMNAEADKHAKIYSELSAEIRNKISADKSYQGSSEHRTLLKKMNSAMTKEGNLRDKANHLK
jgi:hypothetical protein